jgi:hypothetical protein
LFSDGQSLYCSCDCELRTLGDRLAALKQQKKALMRKLLTGQVRVNA